jgi:hypothetical protein
MKLEKKEDNIIVEEQVLKQHLLSHAQISIMLKNYDDIFSSFDPRPFTHRALSDDFLVESKKAAIDKEGNLELSFMIPKSERNVNDEIIIKKRLREHFRRHHTLVLNDIKEIKRTGWKMAILGALMITVASILAFFEAENTWLHFLIILLEPAGWFTGWTGLDELHYGVKEEKPILQFYEKMVRAEIAFHPY